MTIKTKLTLNVVIVLAIVGAVFATSIIGMGFVKSKLFYLTERSTPFQMRTVEFQRAMQGTAADLIKLSASGNMDEYKSHRSEAENSLSEVKKAQDALESLSGGTKMEAYNELNSIATELFQLTEGRLKAEEGAVLSNKTITQKLNEASQRLKELDTKIKGLQNNRSTAFVKSLGDTKNISTNLRNVELLKEIVKDLQLAVFEVQRAQEKRAIIIARGKVNSAINKALHNEYLKESKGLNNEVKDFEKKTGEMVKLRMSLFDQTDGDTKSKYEAINKDVGEKLSTTLLTIEQEVISAGEKYGVENERQGNTFAQANMANTVLMGNSELVALGLSVEGLSTKLFTLVSAKEIDGVESEIKRVFEKIGSVEKSLEKALSKLDAKEEQKILHNVTVALSAIKGLLFAGDGVIAKVRHQLTMSEKAAQATKKLREVVLKQAEKGKETVVSAQGEQEKAIGTVNKMVRFSTMLIGAISIGAVVFGIAFGTWVYRSIAKPLNQLMKVSDEVAGGDLTLEISSRNTDEIGKVQTSMSKMVTNLREIVGKIRIATGSLTSSSVELSTTATVLEKGSQDQTMQIEQSATAMTEMSQTIMDVAKNAADAADISRRTADMAKDGKGAVEQTVQGMGDISQAVKNASSIIEALGESSKEINKVIKVIHEIADQINLLALNAAIEAARAGEHGRGFAVVADEVRQLAEKTMGSTQEVTTIISKIQNDALKAVNAMKQGRSEVEEGVKLTGSAKSSLDKIVTESDKEADMIQRIAVATEEQSAASEEVSQSMESIANITRDLAQSVAKIKDASDGLARHADELNSMAAWFKT